MRKLGGIENVEEFILAIAGGADVNGTWKGVPLIEYYFSILMHIHSFTEPKHEADLKKFLALIAAGADVKIIINEQPKGIFDANKIFDFYSLTRATILRLQLFSTLLESKQAREFVAGNQAQRAMLPLLKERLFHALDVLKRIGKKSTNNRDELQSTLENCEERSEESHISEMQYGRPPVDAGFTECIQNMSLLRESDYFETLIDTNAGVNLPFDLDTFYRVYDLKILLELLPYHLAILSATLGGKGAQEAIAKEPTYAKMLTELKKSAVKAISDIQAMLNMA